MGLPVIQLSNSHKIWFLVTVRIGTLFHLVQLLCIWEAATLPRSRKRAHAISLQDLSKP